MSDEELLVCLDELISRADAHGDEPWTVEWLRSHRTLIAESTDQAEARRALGEVNARIPALYQSMVEDRDDRQAARVLARIQQLSLPAAPPPPPEAPANGTAPTPQPAAAGVGALGSTAAARRRSNLGTYAAVLGVALVAIGIATILGTANCGSARETSGALIAVAGGLLGIVTIALRSLEIASLPAELRTADLSRLVGIGQVLSLGITWALVHHDGCTLFGI